MFRLVLVVLAVLDLVQNQHHLAVAAAASMVKVLVLDGTDGPARVLMKKCIGMTKMRWRFLQTPMIRQQILEVTNKQQDVKDSDSLVITLMLRMSLRAPSVMQNLQNAKQV
jgi:hypothetical protein